MRPRRLMLSEPDDVSYTLLGPSVQRFFVHVESESGAIDESEKAFVSGFLEPGSDLGAHGGVAIGSRHGNLLRVSVNQGGIQMNSGDRADRAAVMEGRDSDVMSFGE